MYIAKYEVNGRRISQVRAELHAPCARLPSIGASMISSILPTVFSIDQDIGLAIRIEIDTAQRLTMKWAFTADEHQEGNLKRFAASVLRLEANGVGELRLPVDSTSFDSMFSSPPQLRCKIDGALNDVQGIPVACDMRLFDSINQVIVDGVMLRKPFVYQANVRSIPFDLELVRQVRRNAAKITNSGAFPQSIESSQRRIATQVTEGVAVVEEFCATTMDNEMWLSKSLADSTNSIDRVLRQSIFNVSGSPGAFEDEFSSCLHSSWIFPLSPTQLASQSIDRSQLGRFASWCPSLEISRLVGLLADSEDGDADSCRNSPKPSPSPVGGSDFCFVSYSHADTETVQSVVQQANSSGLKLWWDTQIPGGSEWDAVLERQIENSRGLVLFLSISAVESKYVRREVKYADAIGKGILTIELERGIELRFGLALLLSQYQRLPFDKARVLDYLRHHYNGSADHG
jgi:hypothetical protein